MMTSLFFIMLVLFILTVGYLLHVQKGLKMTIEQQKQLLNLNKQFKPLEESGYFHYLPRCKKYIVKDLMGHEIFKPEETTIKPRFRKSTLEAGKRIMQFLERLNRSNPSLSYLLVIEGNTANTYDRQYDKNNNWGYITSYKRALAVYNLWQAHDIDLRQYNAEIMLCGSGFNGLCRAKKEKNNKRFSIQIIPKVQHRMDQAGSVTHARSSTHKWQK
jgi:outer membrane protein OmpA-like peptidoglycan-associated protein